MPLTSTWFRNLDAEIYLGHESELVPQTHIHEAHEPTNILGLALAYMCWGHIFSILANPPKYLVLDPHKK